MKQQTRIILRNHALQQRAIEKLEALELEPVLWEFLIRPHEKKRSNPQNDRLHKLLRMMADFNGDSIEDMKLEMKLKFLEPMAQKVLPNGSVGVEFKSTARMTTVELNDFMEKVEAFAAMELQITLPAQGWRDVR